LKLKGRVQKFEVSQGGKNLIAFGFQAKMRLGKKKKTPSNSKGPVKTLPFNVEALPCQVPSR
jgi:hypothetical protein